MLDRNTLAGDSARYAGRNASSIGDMEMLTGVIRRSVLAARLAQLHVDSTDAARIARMRPTLATERLSEQGRAGSGMLNALFGFGLANFHQMPHG